MADRAGETVEIGVVITGAARRDLAEALAAELPRELDRRFPGFWWAVRIAEVPVPAGATATSGQLVGAIWRRLLDEGWELAVGLTDLPLRAGRRPVTAHASATHGVGLVSVPALGAVGLQRRLRSAVTHLIEGLLGESVGGADRSGRSRRMTERLRELASPLGHARVRDDGSVRFVGAALRGNLRLLVGMVRANQPSRVIVRLSGAMVGALAASALALATPDSWRQADAMGVVRLVVLTVGSVVSACLALVLAHGLWERAATREARERVVLFNLATSATIALGVLTLYAALFVAAAVGAAALIPPSLLERALGERVGAGDYVRLAWFVASLATVGGALGSLVESDVDVREAAYRPVDDTRTDGA